MAVVFPGPLSGEQTPGYPHVLTLDRIYEDPPLDGRHVRSIQWIEDGSMVGYLRQSETNRDLLELWVADVEQGGSRLLVSATDIVTDGELRLSDEEIQILERKRISQRGITGYTWSPDGRSILFPLGGSLYVYDFQLRKAVLIDDDSAGPMLDPGFSPDGTMVSFVRDGDIWVIPAEGGTARQLTSGASETLKHGLAEFIAMEEMDRDRGYWWSPDGSRIAYLEVDESGVEVWKRASYGSEGASVAKQRYPGAGRPNAVIRVGILDPADGGTRWIDFPDNVEHEYVARVEWGARGEKIALEVEPRDQKSLTLLFADPSTGEIRTVLEERSESFINLHDDLVFLDDGRFLWSSERSNLRQIYLYDQSGKLIRQITHHDLPVVKIEGVDEERNTVFYSAVTNRSLEKHLFSISLEGGEPVRLTHEAGWHAVKVSDDGRFFVDSHSTVGSPVHVMLKDASGRILTMIEDNPTPELDALMQTRPEFIRITAADGHTQLNASIMKPVDFDPSRRYPVVVYGYGGPHGHVVADSWRSSALWNQFLAQNGYIVFSVDPRGSSYRGRVFEDEIYHRFGVVEVEDHAAAARYLGSLPYVDGEHIGIWGWSYGGTLTLMSMIENGDLFRCGIAVAPVTDWHWYDTHYTERYLGSPDELPRVYTQASPLERDPSRITGDLLIIHGMADDNVFLRHTLAFTERLQNAGVLFDLMLYPGKTHSIAGKKTRRHLYGLMYKFFETHLKDL